MKLRRLLKSSVQFSIRDWFWFALALALFLMWRIEVDRNPRSAHDRYGISRLVFHGWDDFASLNKPLD